MKSNRMNVQKYFILNRKETNSLGSNYYNQMSNYYNQIQMSNNYNQMSNKSHHSKQANSLQAKQLSQ